MKDKQNYKLGKGTLYITDSFGYIHETDCDEFNIEIITTKNNKKAKTLKRPKLTLIFDIDPFPVKLFPEGMKN